MTAIRALEITVEPSEAGFDPAGLAQLDGYLNRCVEDDLNKGSILIIARRGEVVHISRRGLSDPETAQPVELDTVWRLYSMTKPLTSVAALILCEKGVISLDDPVAKFIPAFANTRVYVSGSAAAMKTAPAAEPMLISHLLTHTSGLTVTGLFSGPVDDAYRAAGIAPLGGHEDYDLEEMCQRLATLPLLFEPGSGWNYSHATDVLGRIIEVASGEDLSEYMAGRLFEPLGMIDTGFAMPPATRLAALYRMDPQTSQPVRMETPPAAAGDLPALLAGGHGIFSTASDYHRFVQMLASRGQLDGNRVLSPRTVDLMTANHLPGNQTMLAYSRQATATMASLKSRGFGLGVAPLLDPVAAGSLSSRGEYGWGGAAGTNFWVDPELELTVLFMMQVIPPPDAIWLALRRLVYQALIE